MFTSTTLQAVIAAVATSLCASADTDTSCPCPSDKKLVIGGVSHGIVEDSFWDPIYLAAERSAYDSNVELDFERFSLSSQGDEGQAEIARLMVDRIEKLCSGDDAVDGVFSSMNDESVIQALQTNCIDAGIPTIAINNGLNPTDNFTGFLHFVGADDTETGKDSGEKLVSTCTTCDTFYCLDHCSNCPSWKQRCRGFGDAVGEGYGEKSHIIVDPTNVDTYLSSVEDVIGDVNGTWDNIGLLLGAQTSMIDFAVALAEKHPGVKIAGIDTSPGLYEVLGTADDNDKASILWGTDQQPYLQGYYPVQLLANTLRMGQNLQVFDLESGPKFVTVAPEPEEVVCAKNPYHNCDAAVAGPVGGDDSTPAEESADTTESDTADTTAEEPADTTELDTDTVPAEESSGHGRMLGAATAGVIGAILGKLI